MRKYVISLVSVAAFLAGSYYVFHFPLALSIGFIVVLLIHELGHVLALWWLGKKVKGLYFLPLVGAFVVSSEQFRSRNELALFKYAGPLAGMFGVLVTLICFGIFHDDLFLILTVLGGVLNLVNMIPLTVLDGQGVLVGVHKNTQYLGVILLLFVGVFVFQTYELALFLLILYVLYNFDDSTRPSGFEIHEIVIATGCVFILAFLIGTDRVDTTNGFIYLALSIWSCLAYLKSTLIDKVDDKWVPSNLIPLSAVEKRDWSIRWFLLTSALAVITYFAYGAVFS
jgi:hypothetical protein